MKPLHAALTAGEDLLAYLRRSPLFFRVEVCGECRRRKDVVSSLDVIAVASDETAAADHFFSWRHSAEEKERSARYCAAMTGEGLLVTIRFVDAATFGGSLFRYTGCEGFTALFVGHEHAAEEGDIFAAAGLPVVPPELREDRGEIAFAQSDRFHDLIEQRDIKADLHVHSVYSDGQNSVPLIADRARKAGYEYIGVTDHSMSLDVAKGLSPRKFFDKLTAIEKLNRENKGFTVLCGIEVDILPDGTLDYPDDVLDAADYVIGSVHMETKMPQDQMTARIIRAVSSGKIDIVGHPTGRIFGVRESLPLDFDAVAQACAAHGVALEISGYTNRFDLNDENILRAKKYGAVFSTNTDAHFVEHLDRMTFAVWNARRALLTRDDVVNTKPLAAFKQWIRARRNRYGRQ